MELKGNLQKYVVSQSILAFLAWCIFAGAAGFYGNVFEVNVDVNLYHFFIVPGCIILLALSLYIFKFDVKFNIQPRYLTLLFTILHGLWAIFVIVNLPDVMNGYIAIFVLTVGIWYISPFAGVYFTVVFALSFCAWYGILHYALNLKVGVDEYVFVTYYLFAAVGGAIINGFIAKLRAKVRKEREEVKRLNLEISENVLTRFLPPDIVKQIVTGKTKLEKSLKNTDITVLFADICDFTKISQEIRPSEVSALLNGYLEEMMEIVFKHSGTIDKIIGDSIMVMWGAPHYLSREEQAAKAYECSVEMMKKLDELNDEWRKKGYPSIKKRIGIHHGMALVGYFGGNRRLDYTAIGTTVNMAQRIEGIALPNTILISERMKDLLPSREFKSLGPKKLKGISREVNLYEVKI